jgi:hypothetical protein
MRGESSATRSDVGKHADRDTAGRKAWHAPRLATIDIEGAEAGAGFRPDGPYPPS